MSLDREAPPDLGRLAREAWLSGIGIAFFLVALAWCLQSLLVLDGSVMTKALAAYLVGFAVLLANLPQHAPIRQFGVANQTTLVRIALVALLFGLVGESPSPAFAWLIVGIAGLASGLDAVDGWLARRHRLVSRLGQRFDMETDALLILALSILAWQLEKAGAWILIAGKGYPLSSSAVNM